MSQGEKKAVQARAKETRDKLVKAFEHLLAEKPLEDISVSEIAERAGVSVGTVYRRFENRDAFLPIVLEVYETRLIEFASSPEGRLALDPEKGLLHALNQMTRIGWLFLDRNSHLVRASYIIARTRPDLVGEVWDEMLAQSALNYRQVLELFADEIVHDDLHEAGGVVLYLMNVGLSEYALYPTEGPAAALNLEPDQFCAALARSIYGYLSVTV